MSGHSAERDADLRERLVALADRWSQSRDSIVDSNWMPGVADQKRSLYDRLILDLRATVAGHEPIYGDRMPILVACTCGWRVRELYEDYDAHLRAALARVLPPDEGRDS